MKKLQFIPALIFIFIIGCSNKLSYETVEDAVNSNINFYNEEDLDGVMSTIDENSPVYSQTKKLTEQIFDTYDLNYKLEKTEIMEQNEKEAKIKFVQITTKIKRPAFRNNRWEEFIL